MSYAEVAAGEHNKRPILRNSPNRAANIFGFYFDVVNDKGRLGEFDSTRRMDYGHRLLEIAEMLASGSMPSIRQARRLDRELLGPDRTFGLANLVRRNEAHLSEMDYVAVCDYGMSVMERNRLYPVGRTSSISPPASTAPRP